MLGRDAFPRIQQMVRSKLREVRPGLHRQKGGNPNGTPTATQIEQQILAGLRQRPGFLGKPVLAAELTEALERALGAHSLPLPRTITRTDPITGMDVKLLVDAPLLPERHAHEHGFYHAGLPRYFTRIDPITGMDVKILVSEPVTPALHPTSSHVLTHSPSQFIKTQPAAQADQLIEFKRRITGVLG